jgi:Uncharacterized protein conserved in bacteria (DUF2188)
VLVGGTDTQASRVRHQDDPRVDHQTVAKKPAIHTVPHDGGWANRREGAARVSKVFPTKAAAQAAGRETARRERTEHIIHKKDGEIGGRNSYGNDPPPPMG